MDVGEASNQRNSIERREKLVWNSVEAVTEAVAISPALKAELEMRLEEFEANPQAGFSWDQVKALLENGAWRSV
jgi:putative addiction module component (TIGR02574 family)